MTFYARNRQWSDQFLPDIKRIVGAHLLRTAPDQLDRFHATDLLMLDAKDMRIARVSDAQATRKDTPTSSPFGQRLRLALKLSFPRL